MIGEDRIEVVHWSDQDIHNNSYVSVTLAHDEVPTEPETTSISEISVQAIQRDLDALSKELSKMRGSATPRARQISGALQFQVATPKYPQLLLRTDAEQYLQVRGVWSGEEQVFAMDGRSFSADKNGQPHAYRTWFKDVLRIGDKAKIEVESAI
jgi:hypothetical protein